MVKDTGGEKITIIQLGGGEEIQNRERGIHLEEERDVKVVPINVLCVLWLEQVICGQPGGSCGLSSRRSRERFREQESRGRASQVGDPQLQWPQQPALHCNFFSSHSGPGGEGHNTHIKHKPVFLQVWGLANLRGK